MKHNLTMLRVAIEQVDADPVKSLAFYNNPEMRIRFIKDVLMFSITQIDNIEDPIEKKVRSILIMDLLDKNYQQYAWPAHETHFHTNFMQHAGCPFACLNEISTIIEKIIKNNFAA